MEKKPKDEPKQKTPKGEEIPIPTRGDFFRDMKKAATPAKSRERRPKK